MLIVADALSLMKQRRRSRAHEDGADHTLSFIHMVCYYHQQRLPHLCASGYDD